MTAGLLGRDSAWFARKSKSATAPMLEARPKRPSTDLRRPCGESLVEVFGRASRDSPYGEAVALALGEDEGFGVGALHRALLARPKVEAAGATLPVMTTRERKQPPSSCPLAEGAQGWNTTPPATGGYWATPAGARPPTPPITAT